MKVKTWGPDGDPHNINDGTNYDSVLLNTAYGLREVEAKMSRRSGEWPILGAINRPEKEIYLNVIITGGSAAELMGWFDPSVTEEESVLVVEDDGGGNDRYIEAVCTQVTMTNNSGLEWIISLQISEDVYYRELTATVASSWNLVTSGTNNYTNNGDMNAYPIITITPTSQKSGSDGYTKKRFFTVLWGEEEAAISYPTDIAGNSFDTLAEVSGGDMQIDGDDLRVFVDGIEVNRWLVDINTTTTSVWCNMDWSADITLNLLGNHNSIMTTIYVYDTQNIESLPSSGIIKIGSELITYTGKNNTARTLTGCTRGAKGTTAASHSHADPIYWVQHDIWILYGNPTVGAPVIDDDFKPIFALNTSSNTTWTFNNFLEDDGYRTGSWLYALTSVVYKYGGNQGTQADPWEELGLEHEGRRPTSGHWGRAYIYVPSGITNANFQVGQKKCDDKGDWALGEAFVCSSANGSVWVNEYDIPAPTVDDTWQTWSDNTALTAGSKYVGIYINDQRDDIWVEVSAITLTITNPFTITIGSELTSYHLACTISNNTTGKSISFIFPMDIDGELEVNTDEKTVIYLDDSTNQFSALTLDGGPRREWLALEPGVNQLQYDETGLAAVTIDIEYEERFYD
jgi:hypothetical protein